MAFGSDSLRRYSFSPRSTYNFKFNQPQPAAQHVAWPSNDDCVYESQYSTPQLPSPMQGDMPQRERRGKDSGKQRSKSSTSKWTRTKEKLGIDDKAKSSKDGRDMASPYDHIEHSSYGSASHNQVSANEVPPPPRSCRTWYDEEGRNLGDRTPQYVYSPEKDQLVRHHEKENHDRRDFNSYSSTEAHTGTSHASPSELERVPVLPLIPKTPELDPNSTDLSEQTPQPTEVDPSQLPGIELTLLGAITKHPELKGPDDESLNVTIARIIEKYGKIKGNAPPGLTQAPQEVSHSARTEILNAKNELRAVNTQLQDKIALSKRLLDANTKLQRDYESLRSRYDKDADKYNSEIAKLKYENIQLETNKSKLHKEQKSSKKEIDQMKAWYEGELRKSREEAAKKQRENEKALRAWSESFNTLKGIKEVLDVKCKNAEAHEKAKLAEFSRDWEAVLRKEQSDHTEIVSGLRSEISVLKQSLRHEQAHKEEVLERQKQELEETHAEEKLKLRKVIEDFKTESAKREHFKSLTDSEIAVQFKRLAHSIDDFSRLEWEFSKELQWPFTEDNMRQLGKNTRKIKQQILQNTLWIILYETIFCTPFRVIGIAGREYEEQWTPIYSSGKNRLVPHYQPRLNPPGLSSSDWEEVSNETERARFETAKTFLDIVTSPSYDNIIKDNFEACVADIVNTICQDIEGVATVSVERRKLLDGIVRTAAKAWLESCSQRYRLVMVFPGGKQNYLADPAYHSERIKLYVRPDLKRYGDSQGKDLMRGQSLAGWQGSMEAYPQ